jgi:hypothetical protein
MTHFCWMYGIGNGVYNHCLQFIYDSFKFVIKKNWKYCMRQTFTITFSK